MNEQFLFFIYDNETEENIQILLRNRFEYGQLLMKLGEKENNKRFDLLEVENLSNLIPHLDFMESLKPKNMEF